MSELIDRIPGVESTLAKLRGVVNTNQQIKAAQRFTGRSGQLGYAVESDLDWDLVETFPYTPPPGYLSASFAITFTGDGTQKWPIVVLSTDVRVNGTANSNRLAVTPSSGFYEYADASGDVLFQAFERHDPAYFDNPNVSRWTIDILYRGTVKIYFKARGQATSDGTFSVVRTA